MGSSNQHILNNEMIIIWLMVTDVAAVVKLNQLIHVLELQEVFQHAHQFEEMAKNLHLKFVMTETKLMVLVESQIVLVPSLDIHAVEERLLLPQLATLSVVIILYLVVKYEMMETQAVEMAVITVVSKRLDGLDL